MNIAHFANTVEAEFYAWGSTNAYPRDPKRYIDVLDGVQAMTTPSTMHMLNYAVQCMAPDEIYLEVGTWRGATLIGALLGNEAHGIAIDNDTMDEHDEDERSSADVWRENVTRYGVADRVSYLDGTTPGVWKVPDLTSGRKVGVYLYDGDKSTDEAAFEGLAGIVPYLAPEAIIFLDDANVLPIRRAAYMFCRRYFPRAWTIMDLPTPANCWACFWNGLIALSWKG